MVFKTSQIESGSVGKGSHETNNVPTLPQKSDCKTGSRSFQTRLFGTKGLGVGFLNVNFRSHVSNLCCSAHSSPENELHHVNVNIFGKTI